MYKRGMWKQVVHGCQVAAIPKKKKKKKKKKKYQNTESVMCKWHCQYEVENNEYLTDC